MNIQEISYDPSTDKILGSFNNEIHIKVYHEDKPVILIISNDLFHKTWDNWLRGKSDYCKRFNHYCGVMGYTYIEVGKFLKKKINLYEYDDDGEMTEHYPPVISVTKFSDYHDFEHG